ncbi:MAG: Uncharacterised protein [Rhodospirillaceae bacterium]|nr:MAG: Uncharacterised protein [Rhodospirillaceae bacterium]
MTGAVVGLAPLHETAQLFDTLSRRIETARFQRARDQRSGTCPIELVGAVDEVLLGVGVDRVALIGALELGVPGLGRGLALGAVGNPGLDGRTPVSLGRIKLGEFSIVGVDVVSILEQVGVGLGNIGRGKVGEVLDEGLEPAVVEGAARGAADPLQPALLGTQRPQPLFEQGRLRRHTAGLLGLTVRSAAQHRPVKEAPDHPDEQHPDHHGSDAVEHAGEQVFAQPLDRTGVTRRRCLIGQVFVEAAEE